MKIKILPVLATVMCLFMIVQNGCRKTLSPEEELARLNQMIMDDTTDASLYERRGNLNRFFNNFDQAIRDYTKALSLQSDNADLYDSRAYLFAGQRKYDRAISDMTKAIELGLKKYISRGIFYRDNGDYELAIADFRKWNDTDSTQTCYALLETCYELTGQYDSAIVAWQSSFKYEPDTREHLSNASLSRLWCLVGNYRAALIPINQEINRNTRGIAYYYNQRGVINLALHDIQKAIADFEMALNKDSTLVLPEYYLAKSFAMQGEHQKAMRYLRKSFQKGFAQFDLVEEDSVFSVMRKSYGLKKLVDSFKAKQHRNNRIMYKLIRDKKWKQDSIKSRFVEERMGAIFTLPNRRSEYSRLYRWNYEYGMGRPIYQALSKSAGRKGEKGS